MKRWIAAVVFPVVICSAAQADEPSRLIQEIVFDRDSRLISYMLTAPASVRLRVGTAGGPLYKTLIDWKRQEKGRHAVRYAETVSGRTTFTLHAFTADDADVRGLSLADMVVAPAQAAIGQAVPAVLRGQIHKRHRRSDCHDPKIKLSVKRGRELIIGLAPQEKRRLRRERFQVHIFIDDVLAHQSIDGYVPYHWTIDTAGLNPGRHTVQVNLAGFADHIGAAQAEFVVK